jgi:hypothetical protein
LWKPFGSLSVQGDLALSPSDMEDAEGKLDEALQGLGTGVLVVVGHSVRDKPVRRSITKQSAKLTPVWIDPDAEARTTGSPEPRTWEGWVRGAGSSGFGGPYAATAETFAHDLWAMYRQRLNQQQAR